MDVSQPAVLGEPVSEDPLSEQLHRATLANRPRRIRRCLARGCSVNATNAAGQTALFAAAFAARQAAADELLRRGADPNARCDGGYTAVHAACFAGRRRLLRRLLDCGGDLRLYDLSGRRPADWARLQQDPLRRRRVLQLIENARLAAMTSSGRDALVERSSGFSAGGGGAVRDLLRRLLPGEQPRRGAASYDEVDMADLVRSVQSVGFGAVYYGGGEAKPGAMAVLPLASERALEPDKTARGYPLGAYTEMAARVYLGTAVSVRRLLERPPAGAHRDLLIAELEAARRLHHPALLLLMAVCPSENLDGVALVFERVPLGSLHHCRYRRGLQLRPRTSADLLLQVCEALQFLHAARWLHCAVTSHAVQLLSPTRAKLACLEHAVSAQAGPPRPQRRLLACCADGALFNWLAPEVLRDGVPSELADTYSFCALTWELVHGRPPWAGLSADQISAQAVGGGRPLPLRPDACPPLLRDLLQLGLRVDPHQRDLQLDEARFMLSSYRDGARQRPRPTQVAAAQTPAPAARPSTPSSESRARLKPPAPAPPRPAAVPPSPARLSRTLSPDARPELPRPAAVAARQREPVPSERRAGLPADSDPFTGLRRTGRRARSATWQSPNASWQEATAIKPASHRLTRHGSSCSLNRRPAAGASPWPPADSDAERGAADSRAGSSASTRQHSVSLDGQSNPPDDAPKLSETLPNPASSARSLPVAERAKRVTRSLPRVTPLVSDARGLARARPSHLPLKSAGSARWRLRECQVQASADVAEAASQTAAGEDGGSAAAGAGSGTTVHSGDAATTSNGADASNGDSSGAGSNRTASGTGSIPNSMGVVLAGGSAGPTTNSSTTDPFPSLSSQTHTLSSDDQMTSYSLKNFAARREFFSGRQAGTAAHSRSDSALKLPQGVRLNPALLLRREQPTELKTSSPAGERALRLGQPRPFQRPSGGPAPVSRVCCPAGRRSPPPAAAESSGSPVAAASTPVRPAMEPDRSEPPLLSSLSSGTPGSAASGHRLNVTFHAQVLEFSAPSSGGESAAEGGSASPKPPPPPPPPPADEPQYYDDDLASPDVQQSHLQLLETEPPTPPLQPPPYACLDDGGRASPLSMELPSSAADSETDADEPLPAPPSDGECSKPEPPHRLLHVSDSDESELSLAELGGGAAPAAVSPCITSSETTRSDGSRVRLFEVACEHGFKTCVSTRAGQDGQCTVTCTNTNLTDGRVEAYEQTVTADQVQTQIVVADR